MRALTARALAVLLPVLLALAPQASAHATALPRTRALAQGAAHALVARPAATPSRCGRECCCKSGGACHCKHHGAHAMAPDCGCGAFHRAPAPASALRDGGSALLGVLAPAAAALAPPACGENTPRLDSRAHLRWGPAPEPPPDDARA